MENHASSLSQTAIVVALGGNSPTELGPPLATLRRALDLLAAAGATIVQTARWIETDAWPAGSGPDYVNGAARIETDLEPDALIRLLLRIESDLGRVRAARFGPRPCDLDLLVYGDRIIPGQAEWRAIAQGPDDAPPPPTVTPHPRMHRRAFALGPLCDLAPDWRHPVLHATAADLFAALPAQERAALRPLRTD